MANDELDGHELDEEGHDFRFYTKAFREDQTKEFLRHYAGVLGDALNPHMAAYWQTPYFSDRAKKVRIERNGLLAALSRIIGLAGCHGVEIKPFLWVSRYIKGNVARDAEMLVEARYRFQEVSLKAVGDLGDGWREWDEDRAARDRTITELDELFEQLIEFAPSFPSLWETDSTNSFAISDASGMIEEAKESWALLRRGFPRDLSDQFAELLLRVFGHLRRLSINRLRATDHTKPADLTQICDNLLEVTTKLAILHGTELPGADGEGNGNDEEAGQLNGNLTGWLRVGEAARIAAVGDYQISRAVKLGELVAIGKYKARRICPKSLSEWQLKRANAPERVESDRTVRRKLLMASED
jgi:hypothetical protein